jgi:hypothetical protein
MRRVLPIVVLAAIMLSALNCATVLVTAPPGSDVKLLEEIAPAPSRLEYKNWYFLYGLVPISDNSTADIIAKHQFKDVRVKTYQGVVDWLISYVTAGLIWTNTVEIEGNLQ